MNPLDAALDIETTGLDPWVDEVVTAAVVSSGGDEIEVFDTEPEGEYHLLMVLDGYLRGRHRDGLGFERIITWNGSEFDLPFLAVRMVLSGYHGSGGPWLSPLNRKGKYKNPRYKASWWGAPTTDIAYDYQEYCKVVGVKWSLKPLAEHLKIGGYADPPDFAGGDSIMALTREERSLYCSSDAAQTLRAWEMEGQVLGSERGQAVLLDGPMTIL